MKTVIEFLESELTNCDNNFTHYHNLGDEKAALAEQVTAAELRQAIALLRIVQHGPIWPAPEGEQP